MALKLTDAKYDRDTERAYSSSDARTMTARCWGRDLLVSHDDEVIEAVDRAGHRAKGTPCAEARGGGVYLTF